MPNDEKTKFSCQKNLTKKISKSKNIVSIESEIDNNENQLSISQINNIKNKIRLSIQNEYVNNSNNNNMSSNNNIKNLEIEETLTDEETESLTPEKHSDKVQNSQSSSKFRSKSVDSFLKKKATDDDENSTEKHDDSNRHHQRNVYEEGDTIELTETGKSINYKNNNNSNRDEELSSSQRHSSSASQSSYLNGHGRLKISNSISAGVQLEGSSINVVSNHIPPTPPIPGVLKKPKKAHFDEKTLKGWVEIFLSSFFYSSDFFFLYQNTSTPSPSPPALSDPPS